MKKIALCSQNFARIGGIENSIINIRSVLSQNHEVKVYSFNKPEARSDIEIEQVSKGAHYNIKRALLTGPVASYFSIMEFVKKDVFFQSCDIIICRSVQFASAVSRSFPNKEVIYIPPAIMEEFYQGVIDDLNFLDNPLMLIKYKLIAKAECYLESLAINSDNVKCLTFSSRLAGKLKVKYPSSNIETRFPGVNQVFSEVEPKSQKKSSSMPTFLYVGRIEPGKNIEFLVDVFSQFQGSQKLVIVGDGSLLEGLKSKNYPNVEFKGSKVGAELAQEYINSDMVILPTKNEGFGQVLIEALCCGTPVLGYGSNVANTAVSEIISHPQFGIEIDRLYDGDLRDAIELAIDKISSNYYVRENIMNLARKEFSWRSFCEKILA